MKQKRVWLLSGVPGSGKSTYIETIRDEKSKVISRDAIRFEFLAPDEDYFAHEDEVVEIFHYRIVEALKDEDYEDIYIDATHISPNARKSIMRLLDKEYISELNCLAFDIPYPTCVDRNNKRNGRARVPESAIFNMWRRMKLPTYREGFDYIYIIDEYGNRKELNRE